MTIKSLILSLAFLHTVFSYEKLQPTDISTVVTQNIFFLYHKGPTVNDFTKIPYEDGLSFSEYPEFISNRQTVFYFHGWTEKPSEHEESVDTIVSAFLSKNSVNLVVLDYSALVKGDNILNYLTAVKNVTDIGQAFGYFLKQYIPNVQSVEQIHLIGHSLGSQVMSRAANAYGQGQLPWLTGLDPAGPLFNIPLADHLSKEDAQFVDVVHTDGGGYGDGRSIGHVDFYPNMGIRIQPYCIYINPYEFCSHHMSWRYYAESIRNEQAFPSKKCELNLSCTVANMGYGVEKSARGDFLLKTNDNSPFDMGSNGFYV